MGEFAIVQDLAEQARADGFADVDRHGGDAAVGVTQAVMAALCADDFEAELLQSADQLFSGNSFAPVSPSWGIRPPAPAERR